MLEVRLLRRTYLVQLILRGIVGGVVASSLIAFFWLLTSPDELPQLAAIPGASELRVLILSLQPWELFVAVFLVGAAVDALKRVQGAALDRHNLGRLVDIARNELSQHYDPREGVKLARVRLTGRRRLLEELGGFDPTVITLISVAVALAIVGLPLPALLYATMAVAIPALLPWITSRMDARRDAIAKLAPTTRHWSGEERRADLAAFAEDRLSLAAQSSLEIVNRPVDRLIVAWPVIAVGAGVVAAASVASIVILAQEEGRALLLIVAIVVGARSATKLVGSAENLCFFASELTHPIDRTADDEGPLSDPDDEAPVS